MMNLRQQSSRGVGQSGAHLDGTWLERMARIARGFPGRTVSIQRPNRPTALRSREPWVVCIDGVDVDEILARYGDVAV